MKNMVRVLSLLSLFLLANTAQAAVVFNEVQISPTDARFIELYNNGSEVVDLTGYYIQRKTETGTSFSSLVTSTNFEGKQISAGEYFVISRTNISNTDLVIANMTLTESNTIQLKNGSGEVVDKLCLGSAGDCDGAKPAPNPTEGKTVSLINAAFVETSPTIGGANTATANTNTGNSAVTNTGTSNTDTTSNTSAVVSYSINKKITTKVSHDDLIFSGVPAFFKAETLGVNGEKLIYGKYVWNFGDGVSIESKVSDNAPVNHTYYYPNDYILTVEYYSTEYLWKPDAIFQKNIKVVPSSVFISSIGSAEDFFVELANSSQYDVNISGWQISYENQFFVLPKNTIIQKNQKISYSPKATKFNYTESKDFALYNSNSELIFKYQPKTSVKKNNSTTNEFRTNATNFSSPSNKEISSLSGDLDKVYDLTGDDLTARGYAGLPRGYDKGPYVYGFGLLALLSISGSGVYFLRRSKRFKQEGDFEVFDE
jgi:hypothetical protein